MAIVLTLAIFVATFLAFLIAPLLVPALVSLGGGSIVPVFTVFAIAFAVAASAALLLPEQRGRALA